MGTSLAGGVLPVSTGTIGVSVDGLGGREETDTQKEVS